MQTKSGWVALVFALVSPPLVGYWLGAEAVLVALVFWAAGLIAATGIMAETERRRYR